MPSLLGLIATALLGSTLIAVLRAVQPAAAAAPGDVDCGGSVTSVDAALVLQRTAGRLTSLPCPESSDVNNDGSTNSVDALFILQRVAGLISEFPSCDVTAAPPNAQDDIEGASSGTTICLQAGTYNRLFFFQKTGVRVIGLGPDRTTVVDTPDDHTCLLVVESHDIEIEGVRAQDCAVQGAFAGDSTNVTYSHVETVGGPIGFQYQRSTGSIEDSEAHGHSDFGAILQINSNVTVDSALLHDNDFGIIAQENATVRVTNSSVSNNSQGGIFTLHTTGTTTIGDSTLSNNGLNIFAGVPGCSDLPAGSSEPPPCFLENPGAYVSGIGLGIANTTIAGSHSTGVVIFPGVSAILRDNSISGSQLTGLFSWGAHVASSYDDFNGNVENAIECRAYPAPATGDRGNCDFSNDHVRGSLPLSGNSLGGGFVSEGGAFRLADSLIENNYGIGVQVLHNGMGSVLGNTIRNNGGTAFCISGAGSVTTSNNIESGNRLGTCLGHP